MSRYVKLYAFLLCVVFAGTVLVAAAVVTISEPSADQKQKQLYNRSMRVTNSIALDTGAKYAAVIIKLAHGVDQPGDYDVMKTAIEGVAGVQEISLLIDGQAPSSIPVNHSLKLYATLHLRIDQDSP